MWFLVRYYEIGASIVCILQMKIWGTEGVKQLYQFT